MIDDGYLEAGELLLAKPYREADLAGDDPHRARGLKQGGFRYTQRCRALLK